MLFQPGENITWGINFRRRAMDGDETSMWRYNPERGAPRGGSGPQATADFGHLSGLDLSAVRLRWISGAEVYVSSELVQERGGDASNQANTGVDLQMRLGPRWTGSFTVNPDFGQVEADPDTIQLRDTERFLDERRPFFSEGVELFQTPLRVYHSRRITGIDAGAKVTGTGRNWAAGIINIEGESFRPGRHAEGHYHIGRATWNMGEHAEGGAVWTAVDRDDGYNLVAGIDHRLRLSDTVQLTSQFAGVRDKEREMIVNDEGREEEVIHRLDGHAFYSELKDEVRPLTWELNYTDISEDFLPELGYIPRRNIRGPEFRMKYVRDLPEGVLRTYSFGGSVTHYRNQAGQTTLRDYSAGAGLRTRSDHSVEVWYDRDYHAPYRNRVYGIWLGLNQEDYYRSLTLSLRKGIFRNTPYLLATIRKPFRIGERFTVSLSFDRRIEERFSDELALNRRYNEVIWLARAIAEYTFEWEGRVRLTVEQSSEDRFNRTLLFAFEDVKRWDYYLVLTNADAGGGEIYGAFTKFVYRF